MEFKIIFDNYEYDSHLQTLWGFACIINNHILFDTGSNGRVLLKNCKKMGIDLKNIDIVFISHNHWDHIGGLDSVIEENPNIKLIVPNTLSKRLIKDLKSLVKEVIIIDQKTQITKNIYTTGILGDEIPEQSMLIKENNKNYLIVGCSHFGIENIVKAVNEPIEYIIGGFHLLNKTHFKNLDNLANYITPTHCTGDKGISFLKQKYKNFIPGGVGKIIKF